MDKPVEIQGLTVVVKMGFDETSVETRNLLAQVAHLVEYEGPKSKQIVFRVDTRSLQQAAEWGIKRPKLLKEFKGMPQISSVIKLLWRDAQRHQTVGKYSRWFSHRSPFGQQHTEPFYTRLRVVQTFWVLKRSGKSINAVALSRGIQHAIYRARVGKWDELVAFAGYNPDEERLHEEWSREKIVKELQARRTRGEPINYASLEKSLQNAIRTHFHGWKHAVRAAGYNPDEERRYKEWPEAVIVREVQLRHAKGLPIDWKTLRNEDPRLLDAMVRKYGSWHKGVLAAGFNPETDWPGQKAFYGKRYTPEEVLQQILLRYARGDKLTGEAIREDNWGLLCSGEEHFNAWNGALEAAGLAPIRQWRWWSQERVILALQAVHANGEPINPGYLVLYYQGLCHAVYNQFRSAEHPWEAAASAAGFNPEKEMIRPGYLKRRR